MRFVGRLLRKLAALIGESLPVPADQAEARDSEELNEDGLGDEEREQRTRLRLKMLEKETRGGFR